MAAAAADAADRRVAQLGLAGTRLDLASILHRQSQLM